MSAGGGRIPFLAMIAAIGLTSCSNAPSAGPATTTTAPLDNSEAAVRAGCQHLPQLERQVSETLSSSNVPAGLRSVSSGAAWKAVANMVQPTSPLTGKYRQFTQDVAALNLGFAAATVGGPTGSLTEALSRLSTDCKKETIPCVDGCSSYNHGTAHNGIGKGGVYPPGDLDAVKACDDIHSAMNQWQRGKPVSSALISGLVNSAERASHSNPVAYGSIATSAKALAAYIGESHSEPNVLASSSTASAVQTACYDAPLSQRYFQTTPIG